jgi:hypothetical protein
LGDILISLRQRAKTTSVFMVNARLILRQTSFATFKLRRKIKAFCDISRLIGPPHPEVATTPDIVNQEFTNL